MLRSAWGVGAHLRTRDGSLPDGWQEANVWAVYPTRLDRSAKVRVCVEFLEGYFRQEWSRLQGVSGGA